jgi:hypothetical protein
MSTRLSRDIRTGFDQAQNVGNDRRLARLRTTIRSSPGVRSDPLLLRVIRSYRRGPKAVWAPVLLELLAPAILASLVILQPIEPGISEEDIRQQLVLEVLEAADSAPLSNGARFIKRRLIMRAAFLTSRWLQREANRQRWQLALEDVASS